MKRYLSFFLIALSFDIYWTLVVLFREQGLFVWLALAIAACLLLPVEQQLYAIILATAGCALDALWVYVGLFDFNDTTLLPLWMVALWLMFASVWTWLSATSLLPKWLLVLSATFGGPLAYVIANQLDAVIFFAPTLHVAGTMASGWLVMMWFYHRLLGR